MTCPRPHDWLAKEKIPDPRIPDSSLASTSQTLPFIISNIYTFVPLWLLISLLQEKLILDFFFNILVLDIFLSGMEIEVFVLECNPNKCY